MDQSYRLLRRTELIRGWRVLLAATIGCALGASAYTTLTLGFFLSALHSEFGWGRSEIGTAASAFLVGMLIFLPMMGRICDRVGARRVVLCSIVVLSLTLASIGLFLHTIHGLYIGYFAIALGGAGTSFIVYSRAINTWFDAGRGFALGIMIAGTGITTALAPFVLVPIITGLGWRAGYFALAAFSAIALVPAWIWVRERADFIARQGQQVEGMPLKEILRTRQFWTLAVALFFISPVFSGTVVHLVPMYTDMGATPKDIKLISSALGVAMILARPTIGKLIDRLYAPNVAAVALCFPALALLLAKDMGLGFGILYAISMGIGLSAESDLTGYLASRFFGMRAYSEAYGWLFAAATLGFAVGPILASFAFDQTGSYDLARYAGIGCCLVGIACFLSLRRGGVKKVYPFDGATQASG